MAKNHHRFAMLIFLTYASVATVGARTLDALFIKTSSYNSLRLSCNAVLYGPSMG